MAKVVDIRAEGLAQRLEGYLTGWAERSGVVVEIWALPARTVPRAVAQAVYATLVEALANAERHAATHVSIAITVGASGLRMTVSDDGAGFASGESGQPGGRGPVAMRAHFAEAGGTLTANSIPGSGTTIIGLIPA
ncbi:hypothetical protein N5079_16615 [Planotetraspora sp. A-T 1434]|uniref:sensor histidine kinase n=1 Tax=Planotetraspora sp. A-T 1434 TaxID=2979219 RepID=UPI0021C14C5B|nr:ATP-binding protein [Planotetraspora sp. A-T 1434]MCT9931835.1 hypothetical protein [Planotetraspora sp. A-T 1434]